jgi:hypothetical protein
MATLTYGSVVGGGPGWTKVDTPQGVRTVYGDRATRNNNPGNIEAGRYANSMGAIGTDGRFAVFGNRVRGTMAQTGLVFGKNYSNLTLRQAIEKYAPSFENNSAAYAAAVAAAAGVSLDTKMKDIPPEKRSAVVKGMQAVEGNTSAKAYDEYGNLTDTLDTVSRRTPATAPTPYGPNSQQALASTRPDNRMFAGPKGLFSVDSQVASRIGQVTRSPLGPVAPSRPSFSGMATPRGVNTAAPSRSSLGFTSQDEKANTGSYKNAPNPGNFTSQDERASISERMGIPGAVAPSASTPSPAPPSTLGGLNYSSPKGIFSVDPGAKVQASIAPSAIGPAAPQIGLSPAAPAAITPTRPTVAPVAAVAAPKQAVAVAAPATPSYSRQSLAPARPSLSAADVYGGSIGTAQTSTPGTTVSRAASYGPTYTSNKFGAVTATAPDGTQMAAWGGVPSKPAISGPLGLQGINAPAPAVGGMFGPKAKSATGMLTGAAIGGYALGPLGAALGGLIGKNVAQGKSPLSGILGGKSATNPGMQTVDTYAGKMSFSNPVGGLGFPSAPAAPKGSYTGPKGGNGGLSSQARDALGKNNGLY